MPEVEVNPRAVAGDNRQPEVNYAAEESRRLSLDYAETARTVADLSARFYGAPAEIADDDEKGIVSALIRDMRDANKRIDGFRELEKQPHYRRGQGVDQFFFGLMDRLFRREKRHMPGMADSLGERLTAYDRRKLAEELERRRLEAERLERDAAEARRLEQEARDKAAKEASDAEEARLAAERARNPERIAEKVEAAVQQERRADAAAVDAARVGVDSELAQGAAVGARIDSLARPADVMRRRDAGTGVLTTMARENYAEIADATKLDKSALWPFISLSAKETALRQWAKNTGHSQQMPGALVGSRPVSVVR